MTSFTIGYRTSRPSIYVLLLHAVLLLIRFISCLDPDNVRYGISRAIARTETEEIINNRLRPRPSCADWCRRSHVGLTRRKVEHSGE